MHYDSLGADVNPVLLAPDTPLPLSTAAYTWLNRAEAAELGWTSENAAEMLSNGIQASFASFGALYDPDDLLALGDGAGYASARVADAATLGYLQVIREEKWIALYPSGFDAWSEWRRTEIPVLIPAAVLIRRPTTILQKSGGISKRNLGLIGNSLLCLQLPCPFTPGPAVRNFYHAPVHALPPEYPYAVYSCIERTDPLLP
jgi:hypothetical protein